MKLFAASIAVALLASPLAAQTTNTMTSQPSTTSTTTKTTTTKHHAMRGRHHAARCGCPVRHTKHHKMTKKTTTTKSY